MNTPVLFLSADPQMETGEVSDSLPLRARRELIAGASQKYFSGRHGCYLEQGLRGSDASLYFYDMYNDRQQMWFPISVEPRIMIACMLHQAVSCELNGNIPITLQEGYWYCAYLPPGVWHKALFPEGHTKVAHLNLSGKYLEDMQEKQPWMKILLECMAEGSGTGILANQGRISVNVLVQIEKLKTYKEDPRHFSSYMHARVLDILFDLITGLEQNNPIPFRSLSFVESITAAKELIDFNEGLKLTVAAIAAKVGLTIKELQKGFRAFEECTVDKYQGRARLKKAAELLISRKKLSIYKIGLHIGYQEESSFTSSFKKMYRVTPLQYRKRHLK